MYVFDFITASTGINSLVRITRTKRLTSTRLHRKQWAINLLTNQNSFRHITSTEQSAMPLFNVA